ncbi:SETMAR [Cordylochernes scorpioides]|uniref:SETMAR n=1 Tax=Cordylochernes scorpioides TaxID=51811 RepID=A0ABY6JZA3_9ARAC|nr:SETMAR [Cordylochernes scorpioides]
MLQWLPILAKVQPHQQAQGTTSESTTRRWFEKFPNGDTSLGDEEGRGRPSVVDNDQLKTIIEADTRKTTREVAEELNVYQSTIIRHLTQIGKVKKLDKWVPHDLNDVHKNRRFEVSSALLLRSKNEPFIDRIVTCDEKWILYDTTGDVLRNDRSDKEQRWRNQPAIPTKWNDRAISLQQETIFQEQAVNTPPTQPKIPQNKPVRRSPPSALQRNHLPGDMPPRALRAHERNYIFSELECLAIVESVDKFRIYLTERLNATITGKLRLAYLENPKASWTQLVKRVTQMSDSHSVTSFPPIYLMFNVIPPDLRTHLNPYPEITIVREIARSRTQNKYKKDKETFD